MMALGLRLHRLRLRLLAARRVFTRNRVYWLLMIIWSVVGPALSVFTYDWRTFAINEAIALVLTCALFTPILILRHRRKKG